MTPRVCACGCGASMESSRPQARYASDACRSRAWKARTGYRVVRARKPRQNASAKREGVTVYFPTVADATMALLAITARRDGDAYEGARLALKKAIDRRAIR